MMPRCRETVLSAQKTTTKNSIAINRGLGEKYKEEKEHIPRILIISSKHSTPALATQYTVIPASYDLKNRRQAHGNTSSQNTKKVENGCRNEEIQKRIEKEQSQPLALNLSRNGNSR